jgi:XTP/dITP diphosphohydrolase
MSTIRKLKRGDRLCIASHNKGKVREIGDLIAPFGVEAISAGDLNLPEPEETETTFIGNALLKASAAAQASGLPALADDSGRVVPALGGDPGIYSARWAGPAKDFGVAMRKIEERMRAINWPSHDAHFICALALAWPDGEEAVFEGRVDGDIVWPPRGDRGFGYDPIFVPEAEIITFGEMDPDAKHAMSHRARAFAQLVAERFA